MLLEACPDPTHSIRIQKLRERAYGDFIVVFTVCVNENVFLGFYEGHDPLPTNLLLGGPSLGMMIPGFENEIPRYFTPIRV